MWVSTLAPSPSYENNINKVLFRQFHTGKLFLKYLTEKSINNKNLSTHCIVLPPLISL